MSTDTGMDFTDVINRLDSRVSNAALDCITYPLYIRTLARVYHSVLFAVDNIGNRVLDHVAAETPRWGRV